jgi:hypothetical protein
MESTAETTQEDIHSHFGLTYANYLVLPRTLLQSMPPEWQHRFVTCLQEMGEAFDHVEQASVYEVTAAREVEYDMLTPDERKYLGVKKSRHIDPIYWDKDGNEHQGDERALFPAKDPVPHYNRGRTYIAPKNKII